MARDRMSFDVSVGDREYLLEKVIEKTGEDERSKALEEALRCTLSFYELIQQHREAIVDERLDLPHHRVNVRTSLERR